MSIIEILDVINDNTGVTLVISAVLFGFNEMLKTRNLKRLHKHNSKQDEINPKTLQTERELYTLLTGFTLEYKENEQFHIHSTENIRNYIIDNGLFLNDKIEKVALKFADYILESYSSGRDIKKERKILKEFKKHFRS